MRQLLICSILIASLSAPALSGQASAPAAQEVGRMAQTLREATDLQSAQPQAVAQKLDPLLAELRQLRESGSLTQAASRIYQDALLLLVRTQIMLLAPEPAINASFRELLVASPRIDESIFNPREKLLLDTIRSSEGGRLEMQTTPPGATISYLGVELGKTPLDIPLIAGSYRLQLRLQGYLDQEFEALIRPSEILKSARALRRRTVEIPVSINAPATTVILNGVTLGVSQAYSSWLASLPTDRQPELASLIQQSKMDQAGASFFRLAEVPVGEPVKIEFQAACYEPLTVQLAVPEQDVDWTHPTLVRPELRRVELKTETGFLDVSSTPPGAEVWLDGTLQGQTPLRKDVCAGTHQVHVVHRAGQYVQEVNVRPGQAARVSGELRPTIAFLGIYAQNPQSNRLTPVSSDWDTVAKRIGVRSSAFADPVITPEEIDSLRKKELLPVEELFQDRLSATDTDMLLKKISGDVLRVDLLLVGLRAGNRYSFRLYSAIHPIPDLIELPSLGEASLDFLISQLNKAERIGERLQRVDLGVEMIDTPKGLMVLNLSPAVAVGNPMIASGAIIKTIDQKPMVSQELQSYLRSKKPGQSITLEVQGSKDTVTKVPITLRLSGAEYPWGTPDGFSNSVLAMLQHLIDRDPLSDEAKYASLSLARGLMKQKEWKLALDYLSQTKLEPNRSGVCPGTVLYYQGRCYEEIGDRTQAESFYTRAKEFAEATLGTPDGLSVRVLAEQRIQALKKLNKWSPHRRFEIRDFGISNLESEFWRLGGKNPLRTIFVDFVVP